MIEKPLLLDPGYAGLLESSAFRQRAYKTLAGPAPAGVLLLALFMLIPTVITAILGSTLDTKIFIGTAAFGGVAALMVVLFGLDLMLGNARRERMHRLAFEGELVTGRILSCQRKCYPGPVYKLEVQFAATAPSGKEVMHTQALERDDLLNKPLPTPGTAVLVLMVDETFYLML